MELQDGRRAERDAAFIALSSKARQFSARNDKMRKIRSTYLLLCRTLSRVFPSFLRLKTYP